MSGGSGSSGSAQPTQTNVTQTNIPEYAQPYVESMLGATQQQLFNTEQVGGTPATAGHYINNPGSTGATDSPFDTGAGGAAINNGQTWVPGTEATGGTTNITGIKPYQPYSANPSDYVAGFSPLQQQAMGDIGNMQVAGQLGQGTEFANQGSAAGLQYGAQGSGIGQQAAGLAGANIGTGMAGMQAGMSYGQNATNPNAVQAYMNPYLQASLAPQQQLLNQQFGITNAANQGQATQQGAFGGGRQAIMQGLNQQNQDLATNQLVSQGYNTAYNTANQNMQAAASLGMQGAGVGLQGLAGANSAYNTGIQGANTGIAGANTALSGANTLNTLGNSQYNQEMGINQAQLQAGSLQQQQQQNIINQGIQNYNTAQQYPQQQLSFMNSMLRGLPMSSSTTQQYAAAPSLTSQAAGLGAAGAGIYQMTKAEGGIIKEKKFAAGGIASGVPAAKLDSMLGGLSDQQLQQKVAMPQNDPQTAQAAQSQIAFRDQMRNPGIGAAPAPSMAAMAGGGIVAFAGEDGSLVQDTDKTSKLKDYVAERQAILGPNTSGADYLKTLNDLQSKNEEGQGAQFGSRLLQTGLGILGGSSPYAAVNIGQGAKEGVAGMMEDVKAQKAEKMVMAKAQYDVGRMDYTDKAKLLEEAAKDYEGLLNRASKEGISRNEIDAKIKVAGMEIGAANARAQAGYTHAETMEKQRAESAQALAKQNKENDPFHIAYNNNLNVLTDGNPDKATPAQRQEASTAANLETHPGAGVSQERNELLARAAENKAVISQARQMGIFPPDAQDEDFKKKLDIYNTKIGELTSQYRKGGSGKTTDTSNLPPLSSFNKQ